MLSREALRDRVLQVGRLTKQGRTAQEIAKTLNIHVSTVYVDRHNVKKMLKGKGLIVRGKPVVVHDVEEDDEDEEPIQATLMNTVLPHLTSIDPRGARMALAMADNCWNTAVRTGVRPTPNELLMMGAILSMVPPKQGVSK